MKLTHFTRPAGKVGHLRSLGRNLSEATAPRQEIQPVVEALKPKLDISDDDKMQKAKREFALQQLEAADNHHHRQMAHKVKNFD